MQKLDYEQFPFKCRKCQVYGHFARNCPTANEAAQGKEAGWNQVKRSRTVPKNQKLGGVTGKDLPKDPVQQTQQPQPSFNLENRFGPLSSQPEDSHEEAAQKPEAPDIDSQPPSDKDKGAAESSKGTPEVVEEEDQESEESEEEGEIGESQSSVRRSTRGRKTDREKREHETYKDKLQGSQPTLEKLLAKKPKMLRNQQQGSKGAHPNKGK